MNKLVSKNPILRFKEGKKIKKFQNPSGPLTLIGRDGYEYRLNSDGRYYRTDGMNAFSSGKTFGQISLDYSWMTKGTRQRTPEEILKLQDPKILSYLSSSRAPLQNGELETPKPKRRVISGPSFYGTRIGGLVKVRDKGFTGFGDLISNDLKQKLIEAGFLDSDFANVTNFQKALNRYFAKDNAGSILEDGKWGNQTLKAFDFALGKANMPKVAGGISSPVLALAKLTSVTTPKITIPDQLPQINVLIPLKTFNRSDIRQYIKGKGFDPYLFTGSQRKALRMVMNGTGTDEDSNIVKSMGILFKKGGILKFLNAGNLPTAPKAKDRYKYSLKSSEVTPEGEEIKTVKVAPTGYWKFPATILQRVNSQNDTTYIEVPTHTSILGGLIRPRVYARTVIKNANLPYNIGTYLTFTPSFVGPLFSPSNELEYETLKRRFNTAWNLAK